MDHPATVVPSSPTFEVTRSIVPQGGLPRLLRLARPLPSRTMGAMRRFGRAGASERAAGMLEYALLVGFVAVLLVGAVTAFKDGVFSSLESSSTKLTQAIGS